MIHAEPPSVDTLGDRRVILHIGTHKTGTKALQGMLALNRDVLESVGIYIPYTGHVQLTESYESTGHHALAWDLLCTPSKGILNEMLEELRSARPTTVIVSSEEIHPLHHHPEAMQQLVDGFASLGYRTVAVIYLRAQDRYAESLFQQHIRDGRSPSFEEHLGTILQHGRTEVSTARFEFLYSRLLDALAGSFGASNVVARPYLPNRGGENIHRDFLRIVSMLHGSISRSLTTTTSNASFTLGGLLEQLYRNLRPGSEIARPGLEEFACKVLPDFNLAFLDDRFLLLTREETLAFLERFAADNTAVAERSSARIPFITEADVSKSDDRFWAESAAHRRLFSAAMAAWS